MTNPVPYPEHQDIGHCSLCMGIVRVKVILSPGEFYQTRCIDCGAVPRPMCGPVIPMVKEEAP